VLNEETDDRLPCGLKLFLREKIPMLDLGGVDAVDLAHANRSRAAAGFGGVHPGTVGSR
jgi:hypothetical protein